MELINFTCLFLHGFEKISKHLLLCLQKDYDPNSQNLWTSLMHFELITSTTLKIRFKIKFYPIVCSSQSNHRFFLSNFRLFSMGRSNPISFLGLLETFSIVNVERLDMATEVVFFHLLIFFYFFLPSDFSPRASRSTVVVFTL